MVLDFVESRVANPVKVVDWGTVAETLGVVCPCCGWTGRLGECAQSSVHDARLYACVNCAMALVARVFPRTIPFRPTARARSRYDGYLLASNG